MSRHEKSWPDIIVPSSTLIVSSPALITPLPANIFPYELVPKLPDINWENPSFCSFASFFIVSLTPFINQLDSSRYINFFMIPFKSLFENTNVVVPDLNIFLWIAASVADATAVIPNGIKILLSNDKSTFFIKYNPAFSNGIKILHKNPVDCPNLCKGGFDNSMLVDEPFPKAF